RGHGFQVQQGVQLVEGVVAERQTQAVDRVGFAIEKGVGGLEKAIALELDVGDGSGQRHQGRIRALEATVADLDVSIELLAVGAEQQGGTVEVVVRATQPRQENRTERLPAPVAQVDGTVQIAQQTQVLKDKVGTEAV